MKYCNNVNDSQWAKSIPGYQLFRITSLASPIQIYYYLYESGPGTSHLVLKVFRELKLTLEIPTFIPEK
jgi:hypothetical protein